MTADLEYYRQFEPIFGSWKITKLLGEGSFGTVFEIEKEEFGAVYKSALKIITVPKSESDIRSAEADGMDAESIATYYRSFVEDFSRESSLMAKLKGHTNIVGFEDTQIIEHQGRIGWDILIRMELLTPLNTYLKSKGGILPVEDVVKLGTDLCKALEICEKNHIIHRDIKPENIFISENGDFKLGDFGISRMAEKTQGASTKVGTRDYMAPEVFKGDRYDQSVDVYSLSLVLYKLLNRNRLPFLPPAPQPITFSQRNEALEKRISGVKIDAPSGVDASLAEVIIKGCSYDVKDRYRSASEYRKALEVCAGVAEAQIPVTVSKGAVFDPDPEPTEMSEGTILRDWNEPNEQERSPETFDDQTDNLTDSQFNNTQNEKEEKNKGNGIPLIGKIGIAAAAVVLVVVVAVTATVISIKKDVDSLYLSNTSGQNTTNTGSSTQGEVSVNIAEDDTSTQIAEDDSSIKIAEENTPVETTEDDTLINTTEEDTVVNAAGDDAPSDTTTDVSKTTDNSGGSSVETSGSSDDENVSDETNTVGKYMPSNHNHLSWTTSVFDILWNYSTLVITSSGDDAKEINLAEYFYEYRDIDLDGDGLVDSIYRVVNGDSAYIAFRFGNGEGFISGSIPNAMGYGHVVTFIDLNGDNVDEILVTHMAASTDGPRVGDSYVYFWSSGKWYYNLIVDYSGRITMCDVDNILVLEGRSYTVRDVQFCDDWLMFLVDYGSKDGTDQTFDFDVFCVSYDGTNWKYGERASEAEWDVSDWAWCYGL